VTRPFLLTVHPVVRMHTQHNVGYATCSILTGQTPALYVCLLLSMVGLKFHSKFVTCDSLRPLDLIPHHPWPIYRCRKQIKKRANCCNLWTWLTPFFVVPPRHMH